MHLLVATIIALGLETSVAYAAGNVCSNKRYSSYVSPLASYAPAQTYCTSHYSFPHSTSTVTVTATAAANRKRVPATKPTKAPRVFAKLTKQPAAVQKTVCSCIETAPTTTVTVQPGPTPPACTNGAYTDPALGDEYGVSCGSDARAADQSLLDSFGIYNNIYDCIQDCDDYYNNGNGYHCCGVRFNRRSGECDVIGRVYNSGGLQVCATDDTPGAANADYDLALHDESASTA